ncbi:hypothetical protein ABZP36_032251 [Zizania latifolia]
MFSLGIEDDRTAAAIGFIVESKGRGLPLITALGLDSMYGFGQKFTWDVISAAHGSLFEPSEKDVRMLEGIADKNERRWSVFDADNSLRWLEEERETSLLGRRERKKEVDWEMESRCKWQRCGPEHLQGEGSPHCQRCISGIKAFIPVLDQVGKDLNGKILKYGSLIISTGCGASRRLPTKIGGKLPGVHYIRDVADADSPVSSLGRAKKVVIGGGYIGMEVSVGYFIMDLAMILWLYPSLGGMEYNGHFDQENFEDGSSMPSSGETLCAAVSASTWVEPHGCLKAGKEQWKDPNILKVFTFGSVPLKTYLPVGDIDVTAFSDSEELKNTWANLVLDVLGHEEKSENAEFRVKEVQYIQAEQF